MNQNSSYTVPTYPQLKPDRNERKNQKNVLYYSNYCKHSKTLLDHLQKQNVLDSLDLICIDYRFMKDNITYIKLPSGQSFPLPPMINCVPTLCLMPNYEILSGSNIMNYFKPMQENIDQARGVIEMEPNPYCLEKETIGSFGVTSDNFSFYDMNDTELSASGNGGIRQMYNYAAISADNAGGGGGSDNLAFSSNEQIFTPQDEGRQKKLNVSIEQLQQRRQQEL